MKNEILLGDSVYASFNGFTVWLTTNNGYPDDPRNEIGLEPEVVAALEKYLTEIIKSASEEAQA